MLDRESAFSDPEVVQMLKNQFIPVAVDRWYEQRRQDEVGEFYRKVVGQGPRGDALKNNETTQGRYAFASDGAFLGFNNNRDPARLREMMKKALADFKASSKEASAPAPKLDPRFARKPPEGGLVLDVHAKILSGAETSEAFWKKTNESTISRDHMWITKEELEALTPKAASKGTEIAVPESVKLRLIRFHLVDNLRGEPPMWRRDEIKSSSMKLVVESVKGEEITLTLSGAAHLATGSGDRGYDAKLYGQIVWKGKTLKSFDLVSRGQYWGEGTYTKGAPKGKFGLGVLLTLSNGGEDDKVPPQGARDIGDYLAK